MFDLPAVQSALKELGFDAWLLYDFKGLNVLARRVLDWPADRFASRRWFYLVPAEGEPRKLLHRIEPYALDFVPGRQKLSYLRWQELEAAVAELLRGFKRVAMEYVPRNANPYVSRVDGGTIDLVKSCGVEVLPSGDLVQMFEAAWDDEQWQMHLEASKRTRQAFNVAFGFIAERIRQVGFVQEGEVVQRILDFFGESELVTDHPPIVAVGPHSGDPHYSVTAETDTRIKQDEFVLIDLWAKLNKPRAVFSDLTWTGFTGKTVPKKFEDVFQIVARARDAGIAKVREAFSADIILQGWEVDQATRDVIDQAGYGEYFCHRTGHSIGLETHANGANMDNLETREERRVMKRTCFSIEPGIYLPEFGVRSETNVFVDAQGTVHVTGGKLQDRVLPILEMW
jgi:Xaa-Pro aminopeptidase